MRVTHIAGSNKSIACVAGSLPHLAALAFIMRGIIVFSEGTNRASSLSLLPFVSDPRAYVDSGEAGFRGKTSYRERGLSIAIHDSRETRCFGDTLQSHTHAQTHTPLEEPH